MNPQPHLNPLDWLRRRVATLRRKRNDEGLSFAEHTELLKADRAIALHDAAARGEVIPESRQINHHHRTNPHE